MCINSCRQKKKTKKKLRWAEETATHKLFIQQGERSNASRGNISSLTYGHMVTNHTFVTNRCVTFATCEHSDLIRDKRGFSFLIPYWEIVASAIKVTKIMVKEKTSVFFMKKWGSASLTFYNIHPSYEPLCRHGGSRARWSHPQLSSGWLPAYRRAHIDKYCHTMWLATKNEFDTPACRPTTIHRHDDRRRLLFYFFMNSFWQSLLFVKLTE